MGLIMLWSIRGALLLSSCSGWLKWAKREVWKPSRLEVAAVTGGSASVLMGQTALSINKNNSEIN